MFSRLTSTFARSASPLSAPTAAVDDSTNSSANGHTNGHTGQILAQDTSQDTSGFELGQFSIDEYRPMKIIVIGAGFSGIAAGIRFVEVPYVVLAVSAYISYGDRFRQHIPNLEMKIYEKNEEIGGTWFSNRYP